MLLEGLSLFGEANLENARIMKAVLEEFCLFSRHKINSSKSKLCFSTNVNVQQMGK